MKSIMYHYVEKYNPKLKYFSYLDIKNFEKQIIYFKKKYHFFDCKDLFKKNFEKKNFKKKIFLTFDDGLLCHYRYVLPILKKYNLNAIFYVPSGPFIYKKILPVHKIHLILGKYGGQIAYDYLSDNFMKKNIFSQKKLKFFENKLYLSQKNTKKTFLFKKILNYYIDESIRHKVIDKLFNFFFKNKEKYYFDRIYMKKKHLEELVQNNMIIGAHSHTHRVLSKLRKKDCEKDISTSLDFVNNFNFQKTFCYPYGGFHTFNESIQKYLKKKKVSFSMNVESRDINYDEFFNKRYSLPRYDCNNFIHGKITRN